MFIIKNSQLNEETLNVLNTLMNKEINASVAFKMARIIKHLSSIVEDKLNIERKVYDKWTVKGEDGVPVLVKDEDGNTIDGAIQIIDMDKFKEELDQLMEIENEIPLEKINFDDLGLDVIKPVDLIKIDFLFI